MNHLLEWVVLLASLSIACGARPNIIFIIADDLGWNDVGFHGSDQIPTPNIDALAYNGIILNNYYVTPLCSPSRSAILTGKHPIHTGMQHNVIWAPQPEGLPLSEKIMPQYMKDLGYVTRIVGKWHQGFYKKEYTPTFRGFDSHFGYWTAHQDYYDHTGEGFGYWGLDMRRNMSVAWDTAGKYATDMYTEEAVELISQHDESKPLFMYLAHLACHSAHPYQPMQAPAEVVAKLDWIKDYQRRIFAAMVTKLDESVGEVMTALKEKGMLENSIVIFSTDNGGAPGGMNDNHASNWPLRGGKVSHFEGGVRGTACIWSPLLKQHNVVSNQMMHLQDWLPTLYSAAGGDPKDLGEIDGLDMWKTLSDGSASPRTEFVVQINPILQNGAIRVGDYKIVFGTQLPLILDDIYYASWFGPSGRHNLSLNPLPDYNVSEVLTSPAGVALSSVVTPPNPDQVLEIREETQIHCTGEPPIYPCNPNHQICMYNIKEDPCEHHDISTEQPDVFDKMMQRFREINATVVPPMNEPFDTMSSPKYWGYAWSCWKDENPE